MAVAGISVAVLALLGLGYFHYSLLLADERAAATHAENANVALQDELGRLRDRLGAAQGQLAAVNEEARTHQQQRNAVERKLVATEQAASSKGDRISQLTRALDQSQRQLRLTEAQRVTLMARLSKAEADLATEQTHKSAARATLDESQRRLEQLQAERDKAAAERDALKAQINRLEQKSSMLRRPDAPKLAATTPAPAAAAPAAMRPAARVAASAPAPAPVRPVAAPAATPAAAVVAASAPARPVRATTVALVTRHPGPIDDVEHVLAAAGVDVSRLFSQFGVSRGEGGPYVPVPRGGVPPSTLTPGKLAALRAMVRTLPVSAPLDDYTIASPFGARRDPFNGRPEFHTGIDFDAPYMSPVYSTAAGVVTYTGYRSDYGKVVEIDHGHGISTRYAHLHRYTVSVGERVGAHTQIGYLGTTGRSTGPHVLYEVLVNGDPQDPAKFMSLGRVIMVAER